MCINKDCLKKLLGGEDPKTYLIKQVTGTLIGILVAIALGLPSKVANAFLSTPKCKIKEIFSDKAGLKYEWTVELRDSSKKLVLIYPKVPGDIFVNSIKETNDSKRYWTHRLLQATKNNKKTRGIIVELKDGRKNPIMSFSTYNPKPLKLNDSGDLSCGSYLAQF